MLHNKLHYPAILMGHLGSKCFIAGNLLLFTTSGSEAMIKILQLKDTPSVVNFNLTFFHRTEQK